MGSSFKVRPEARARLREAVAYGMLNLGHAIEADAKRPGPDGVVVRGGNRSFNTDLTKAGTPRVGGTLRRSIHTAAFLDGRQIAAGTATAPTSGVDGKTAKDVADSGAPNTVPAYEAGRGIKVIVGTNTGYGAHVELGTSKMRARPSLAPALLKNAGDAGALIRAGVKKHDPDLVKG